MAVIEFQMPSLGADMDNGTIATWYVKPGDKVKKGQMIADVETSKSNIEIESFYNGTIQEILIPEGKKVDVGVTIALMDVEGAPLLTNQNLKTTLSPKDEINKIEAPIKKATNIETISDTTFKLSPRAKKLCHKYNITPDILKSLNKTVITGDDIEVLRRGDESPKGQNTILDKVEQRRKVIAHLMEKSKQTIPHFFIEKEMIIEKALLWMQNENENKTMQERYVPAILYIKALALALKEFPQFNGTYKNETFITNKEINIGIIISLREGGLVAPAIRNVDKKSLANLMQEFRDLVERAKLGKLTRLETQSSTICLTNLGDRGADKVFGVIYPPQVAIIGTGAILKRICKVEDIFKEVPVCNWTLSADHRVSDGHLGSLLLNKIHSFLQMPQCLEDIYEPDKFK